MVDNCPCHNCKDRQVGCHAKCGDYIEWSKENARVRRKIKKAKYLENLTK